MTKGLEGALDSRSQTHTLFFEMHPQALSNEFAVALDFHRRGRTPSGFAVHPQSRADLLNAAMLLGMILLQRGAFDEAERQFKTALELNPRVAIAERNRGRR